jgi:glycerate 2-kinase
VNQKLQDSARKIFQAALRAADARAAVRQAVVSKDSLLRVGETEINISGRAVYVIAIGKAAPAMAAGLKDVLGDKLTRGIVCGPRYAEVNFDGWATFTGGHPLPNEESLAGARAALELLAHAETGALVFFLMSGGGSAMFELPANDDITLAELREANGQLVSCGGSIAEINAVRRAFSGVKGGKLALTAPNTDQITLIVSDTNPGDVANVASGPTVEPERQAPDPLEVVERFRLKGSLPKSIINAIGARVPENRFPANRLRVHYVLLDNTTALEAAALEAARMGFKVENATDINEQEIAAGCDLLLARAQALWNRSNGESVCLLSGGEFSCPVRGNGAGGRNQETMLRCAMKLDNSPRVLSAPCWAILSAGTDGVDGNSTAAGAIANEETMSRAVVSGLNAGRFLEESDSFHFFEQLGDLIVTGPTGTNVRDVRMVLMGPRML